MLVSKFDVDDVISWFGGEVGDLARPIFLVLGVDVHFTGAFDRQAESSITLTRAKYQGLDTPFSSTVQ